MTHPSRPDNHGARSVLDMFLAQGVVLWEQKYSESHTSEWDRVWSHWGDSPMLRIALAGCKAAQQLLHDQDEKVQMLARDYLQGLFLHDSRGFSFGVTALLEDCAQSHSSLFEIHGNLISGSWWYKIPPSLFHLAEINDNRAHPIRHRFQEAFVEFYPAVLADTRDISKLIEFAHNEYFQPEPAI